MKNLLLLTVVIYCMLEVAIMLYGISVAIR